MKKIFAVALVGLFSSCITIYHYHKSPEFSIDPRWSTITDGYANPDTTSDDDPAAGARIRMAIEAAGKCTAP